VSKALLRAAHTIPAFSDYLPPQIYHRSLAGILKQGVERLDNVRQAAGEAFIELLRLPYEHLEIENWQEWEVHERKAFLSLLNAYVVRCGLTACDLVSDMDGNHRSDEDVPGWNDGTWLYPRAMYFLDVPTYRDAVLRGIILSVGSKTGATVCARPWQA
jgi:hypothetical protein